MSVGKSGGQTRSEIEDAQTHAADYSSAAANPAASGVSVLVSSSGGRV
jgi:hypothetical protein